MPKHATPNNKHLPQGPTILYEDRDVIVVDKPAGLLTIGTDRDRERTAYFMLTDYVRKGQAKSRQRIFIVHRLDRDTSGVLVFARTEAAKRTLQDHWGETEKKYLAIVHGHLEKKEDTIASYLVESDALKVYSTANPTVGKLAQTAYRVVRETKVFSLLEVTLLTGRKNQIRVHLSELGHPVAGDRKYNPERDGCSRLALHAWSLTFPHPYSGQLMTFKAEIPKYFHNLVGPIEE